jgi:hypothetical protein
MGAVADYKQATASKFFGPCPYCLEIIPRQIGQPSAKAAKRPTTETLGKRIRIGACPRCAAPIIHKDGQMQRAGAKEIAWMRGHGEAVCQNVREQIEEQIRREGLWG